MLEKRARRRCTGKVSANASARPASPVAALGCPWKASHRPAGLSAFTVLGVDDNSSKMPIIFAWRVFCFWLQRFKECQRRRAARIAARG